MRVLHIKFTAAKCKNQNFFLVNSSVTDVINIYEKLSINPLH